MGLISGTSMDGVDAALVEFADHECKVRHSHSHSYSEELRRQLLDASRTPEKCSIDLIGSLDRQIGECFRDAAMELLKKSGVNAGSITAIGSHGQTLRHQPRAPQPYSLQIGDPNIIATGTGITTVADFRRADIAVGGEGAPLAPAFHNWLFNRAEANRVVLNIGGIANVTVLPASATPVIGFDTGPGNTLLDSHARKVLDQPYDAAGAWAAGGTVDQALLEAMISDPYFEKDAPKSTGFEYFNDQWLDEKLAGAAKTTPADLQATLAELTARSVADATFKYLPDVDEVLVCGGGVHNQDLLQRLERCFSGRMVTSTESYGLHPDWVEAAAFAWLAKRRLEGKPGNLPEVTGASRPVVLGAVY